MKKRVRSVNFTLQETELLISLIESKINIIESKKCDAITWQEKEFTWKTIETDFNHLNLSGEVYRDAKCLRLKFDSLKRDTRKKERIIQYERYSLGSFRDENPNNTTQHFTDLERKIREMIVPTTEIHDSSPDSEQSEIDIKHIIPADETNKDKSTADEDFGNNEIEFEEVETKLFPDLTLENPLTQENNSGVAASKSRLPKSTNKTIKLHSKIGNYSKKRSAMKNKSKRRLVEEELKEVKLEALKLEKQLLQQQIKKEIAHTRVFQQDFEHKKQFQELERQHLILKMHLVRTEIASAKK